MNEQLRKELRKNLSTNPFNDQFNEDILRLSMEKMGISDTLLLNIHKEYHKYFKTYFYNLKNILVHWGYPKKALITVLINFINHSYLYLSQELRKNQSDGNFSKIFSYKTKSAAIEFDDIDISGAAEATVDALASLVNFILKFEYQQSCSDLEVEKQTHLDTIQSMLLSSNYFEVIKDAYETPIWRNALYIEKEDKLLIQFNEEVDLKSFEIARYRMQQSLFQRWAINSHLFKHLRNDTVNEHPTLKRHRPVKIKHIRNAEGFIKVMLENSDVEYKPDDYLQLVSSIELYYPFLNNAVLPVNGHLKIFDVLYMYSLFQELVDAVKTTYEKEDMSSKSTLSHILDKITIDELEYYYLKRTNYQLPQISTFLNLMEKSLSGRFNFWDTPLFKHDYYYQVVYLPLLAPVPYHLIDTLLEKSGIDLEFRGKEFERHIKMKLANLISKLNYTYFICPQSIEIEKGQKKECEEIDLLLFLNEKILIAEVKCIKYPMENRDKHNVEKILLKAAKQIKIKQQFVERNYSTIARNLNIRGNKKEIIPIIITNYPTASGTKPQGIPVLDFSLLKIYFETNEIASRYVTVSKDELSEVVVDKQIMYANEYEFGNNLYNYCYNNPIISSYLSMAEIKFNRITMKGHFKKELFKQFCTANIDAKPFTDSHNSTST